MSLFPKQADTIGNLMINLLRKLYVLPFLLAGATAIAQAPVYFNWQDTFCSNQIVLINNNFYGPNNPSGTEILPGAAANGGDSIIQINFTFFQPPLTLLEQDLCAGDTLWVNNSPYHAMRWLGEEKIFGGAANGCDSIIQVRLNVLPAPMSELIDTLCEGEFMVVNGTRYDINLSQGTELLPGASLNGCDSIVQIQLHFRQIQVSLGPDRTIGLGDTACLSATLNFTPASIMWAPNLDCPGIDCQFVCLQPLSNLTASVFATDQYGCEVTDAVLIQVEPASSVYIPNAFLPDSDSRNNRFFIQTDNSIRVIRRWMIADRWGNIMFDRENVQPNQENEGWDGRYKDRLLSPGVYVWLAELETIDGRTLTRSGDVTLIR
jgi:hypothetical protein